LCWQLRPLPPSTSLLTRAPPSAAALLHDALDATALVEGQLAAMLGDDAVVDLVKQVRLIVIVEDKE
jgi:hypothetical protein